MEISCQVLSFCKDLIHCFSDAGCCLIFTKILKHHACGPQERRRICKVLSGNIRSTSVNGFEHCIVGTNVAGRYKTKAADQTAAKVGENVAVEVLHYHHIKLVRVHDELHAGVVDDLVISLDFRVILCNFTEDREEHAVRHLEDVCLVNAGNFLSAVLLRVLEGVADDALRCFLGNDLDRVNRVLIDLFFFSDIQTFGVLTEDHDIHVLKRSFYRIIGLYRADIRVEIILASKGNV